ncbi:uncharacterized protein LOC141903375 [Tubulanus polymorphus]|uniref:uncharacterized protein LOC141903375 n=1 Tax=Tubulanus polymorphus TaxID=672921 RepID=UPI003DA2FB9D
MPYLPILSAGATAATAADMSSLFPPTITPHMPQTPTANVQPIYHRIYDLGQKDTKCMNDSFLISSAIPAQQTVYPQQQQQQTLVATGPIITTTTPVLPAKSIATPQRPLEPKPIRPNSSTSSNKANTDGKMEQVAAKNSAISNNSSVAKSPNSKSPGNTSNESRRVEIKCKTGSNFKSNKSAADTTTKTVNSTSPESCRDKTKNDEREIKNPSHTSHTVSNILKLKTPESKTGKHVAVETSTSSAAAVTVSSSLVGKYSKNDGTRKVERNVVDSTMNDDTNVKVDDNQELDVVTSSDDTRIPADDRLKTRDAADDERMVLTRNVGDKTERKTSTSSVPNDHRRNNYAGKCDIENSWSGVEKYRDSFIIDSVAAKRAVQSFTFHDDDEIRLKPGHLDDGLNQSICDNTVSCIKPDTCSSSSSYRSGGSGSIVTSDITDRNKITSPTSTTPRKTPPISTGNTEPVANSDVKTDGLTSKSPDRGSAYACPVSSPGSNTSSSSSSNGEFVPALSPAHHLPYYQSLYSIAKTKTTAKDRRKVHAMTFTPEIGTMPGVNPAPANAATSSKCPTITKKEATREVGKRTSGRNSHSRSTKNNSGQKTKKCNDNKRVNASDVTAGWKQTPAAVSNERKRKNDCSKTKKNDTEKLTEESVTGDRVNEINITAPASVHCFANSNDADTCSGVGGSQRSPVSTGSVVDSSVLLPSYADIIHHPGPINLHTGSLKSHAAKTHPNPSGTVAISSPVHGRSNSSSSSSTSAAVYSWNRSLTTCPSRSTVLRGDLGKSVDYATPKRCVNRNAKEADTIRESAIGSKKSGSNKSGHQRRQVLSVDEKKRKTAENIPIASVQATSLSNDHQELENNSTNDSGASTVTSSGE